MRAAARPGGNHRGRHQSLVLASFRPTWRQALAGALGPATLGGLAFAVTAITAPALLAAVDGRGTPIAGPPHLAWFAVLAPLPLGALGGFALRHRVGARVNELGVNCGTLGHDGFAPWRRVIDVRAERRHCRTVVVVYLDDGPALRLRAPYDGGLLGRDPQFEQKLFMICHLWETHRDWSRHN
jgi:hypothetical protein